MQAIVLITDGCNVIGEEMFILDWYYVKVAGREQVRYTAQYQGKTHDVYGPIHQLYIKV